MAHRQISCFIKAIDEGYDILKREGNMGKKNMVTERGRHDRGNSWQWAKEKDRLGSGALQKECPM